jgi:hypothetical protein
MFDPRHSTSLSASKPQTLRGFLEEPESEEADGD